MIEGGFSYSELYIVNSDCFRVRLSTSLGDCLIHLTILLRGI